MNLLYVFPWLVKELAAFIVKYGEYGIKTQTVTHKSQAFILISAIVHEEMLVQGYNEAGVLRFTESGPMDAEQVFALWAEDDVCLCAKCTDMLTNGDDVVQHPVYKWCGELSYIELAHRDCLPEWGRFDDWKGEFYYDA